MLLLVWSPVYCTHKYDRGLSRLLYSELHWLDVTERVQYKLVVVMFSCLHSQYEPITAVPRISLGTSVGRLSKAASSIRYSASLGGSAMPAQHTRSTGLLCGRPVALELSTRQLERSGSWKGQFRRLLKTHLFTLY